MPIIDPSTPSNSYLVYKLLANSHNLLQPPFDRSDPEVDTPEIARLRRLLVVGMPMPPSTLPDVYRPRKGEIEWLSAWILHGAHTQKCP